MRRNALAALILLGIAAVPAISLAGCATESARTGRRASSTSSSDQGSPKGALSIDPSAGSPRTTFSLRFTAPASSGVTGTFRLGYTLSVTGPGDPGCIGARSLQVASAIKDVPLPISLDPIRLGGTWCPGTYTARVVEVVSPVCTAGMMCPQFVRVVGTVATVKFRVKA